MLGYIVEILQILEEILLNLKNLRLDWINKRDKRYDNMMWTNCVEFAARQVNDTRSPFL